MNEFLKAVWAGIVELAAILREVWKIGNRWARIAILVLLLFPAAIVITSLSGSQFLVSLAGLLPLIGVAALLAVWRHPLILAALATTRWSRQVLIWALLALAAELGIGLYFSLVPVANERTLIPTFLIAVACYLLLAVTDKGKGLRTIVGFIVIALTFIFIVGGREAAVKLLKEQITGVGGAGSAGSKMPASNLIVYYAPPKWEGRLRIPAYAGGGRLVDAVVINLTNEWTGYIALPWQWGRVLYTAENDGEYWIQFLEDKESILTTPRRDVHYTTAKSGIFRARAADDASGEPKLVKAVIRRIQ